MKTQRYLFVLSIICLSFLLVKCGKDGAVGPAGTTGDKGAAGVQGAVGPAGPTGTDGKAGSIIYSGSTTPLAATGVAGDFYLNTSTGLLYGPKTAAGWGAGVSLKGATGATGAAGSKTLSGTGAPAAGLGSNGDFYLNKSNYLLYGPKTDAGWGTGLNLQGPAGTANVIYSDWITPTTYTQTTIFGTIHFSSIITAAKITQDILDKGTVIVYGKLSGYNPIIWPVDNVAQLPIIITYMSGANSNIDTWSGITSLGQIQIDLTSSLNAYGSISNAHSFRYVIIPGGVHITANINFKNYAQVKQALHLTD
ncbi:MAG: hypothetical protein JWR38_813 [Mucilaginibacter sp.]|nr:hypothetical protein [Mucilaginibacter sp.]